MRAIPVRPDPAVGRDVRPLPSGAYGIVKRGLDAVAAAVLLAGFALPMVVIAIAIRLDSEGPALFRQRRSGRGSREFVIFKFRTMAAGTPDLASHLIAENAARRITRLGGFLRRTSLDELPQLINVLRGSMSLVGPRPEEEAVVALYDERQRLRLGVKPGMTGPMQVYGRADLTFEERLAIERDYLDNISLAGDLAILLRTPRAILRGEGAY
jgi:lipopolysaccharide/colanic/teichoic acid biosynthesis glycosyltransferase